MSKINLGPGLDLPLEVVTQTAAIIAKRRAGKSYLARRLVEQVHKAGQQIVIVDPKGDWWGVRAHSDGKRPGLPITILGGERGDVPLEPGAGEVVAKLVVEERVSVLLDCSLLRKHQVATFMEAFLETLYRLKAREAFRTPVLLVIDEADAIAPQKPQANEARMLGAAEDIVRRGGQRGLGAVFVTQRAAVLNKNVLTQAQVLIALRTIAPQDLKAMNEWIDVHGTDAERKTLMGSLPALPVGDAWVWSPGWPTAEGIFKRMHTAPIETYDSGATPKPGQKRAEPKTLADVDLEALRRQMAETIRRAEENDPKRLKAEIARLKKEAGKVAPVATPPVPDPAAIQRAADAAVEKWKRQVGTALKRYRDAIEGAIRKLGEEGARFRDQLSGILDMPAEVPAAPALRSQNGGSHQASRPAPAPRRDAPRAPAGDDTLTGPERRILDAIAWMEAIGIGEPSQVAVAFLAGYTYGGGAFNNPRGSLRTKGLVDYSPGERIRLTDEGRALANFPEQALTAEDLQGFVMERLPNPELRILRPLLESYPEALDNETLAAKAGYAPNAGAFNNPRGRLRTLGLVEYPSPGMVRACSLLFLE